MRYILNLFAILTLISCGDTTTGIPTISILEDATEAHFQAQPETDAIIDAFGLKEDKWQAVRFRYKAITDVSHNPQSEVHLKSAQYFLDNELERDTHVTIFIKEVSHIVEDTLYRGREHSSIFKPLLDEIRTLQQDSTSATTIYLFSDLQENDPYFFSVYNPAHIEMLTRRPEQVQQMFLEYADGILSNTARLLVIVVYQPRTVEEDWRFMQMKSLYQKVFQELRIPIVFQSNM